MIGLEAKYCKSVGVDFTVSVVSKNS